MDDIESIGTVLHVLKDTGMRQTLDDVGTGYSNLSYLRRLPTSGKQK